MELFSSDHKAHKTKHLQEIRKRKQDLRRSAKLKKVALAGVAGTLAGGAMGIAYFGTVGAGVVLSGIAGAERAWIEKKKVMRKVGRPKKRKFGRLFQTMEELPPLRKVGRPKKVRFKFLGRY